MAYTPSKLATPPPKKKLQSCDLGERSQPQSPCYKLFGAYYSTTFSYQLVKSLALIRSLSPRTSPPQQGMSLSSLGK